MAIPVSIAVVQKFDDIEIFVMSEEISVSKEPKKTKAETPQIIKETPEVKEEKPIEPVVVSEETHIALNTVEYNTHSSKSEEVIPKQPLQEEQKIYQMEFGSADGPKFLHREMPIYPMMARRLGKEGRVVLKLTIDEKGNLLNVEVVENDRYGFREAAIEAVKKSTFLPATKNGRPVLSQALLSVRFMLRD